MMLQPAGSMSSMGKEKKIAKSYVLSGKISIETNDGQLLRVTGIKQLARYQ